jgi:hypothetical protein
VVKLPDLLPLLNPRGIMGRSLSGKNEPKTLDLRVKTQLKG